MGEISKEKQKFMLTIRKRCDIITKRVEKTCAKYDLWRSRVVGRARAIGNRVTGNTVREFESLLLRQTERQAFACLFCLFWRDSKGRRKTVRGTVFPATAEWTVFVSRMEFCGRTQRTRRNLSFSARKRPMLWYKFTKWIISHLPQGKYFTEFKSLKDW